MALRCEDTVFVVPPPQPRRTAGHGQPHGLDAGTTPLFSPGYTKRVRANAFVLAFRKMGRGTAVRRFHPRSVWPGLCTSVPGVFAGSARTLTSATRIIGPLRMICSTNGFWHFHFCYMSPLSNRLGWAWCLKSTKNKPAVPGALEGNDPRRFDSKSSQFSEKNSKRKCLLPAWVVSQ